MLKWGEASPEEKKRLIIAFAVAAAIIIMGSVMAIMFFD